MLKGMMHEIVYQIISILVWNMKLSKLGVVLNIR